MNILLESISFLTLFSQSVWHNSYDKTGWSGGNAPDLYLGGAQFRYHPGHRP